MDLIQHLSGGNRKQSTIDSYERRLRVLHGGKPVDNLAFLYDYDVILEKIQKYKPTTQRGFIISIVSVLKDVKTMKSMYEKYSRLLEQYNRELKNNNTKSEVQKNNWISQEEVHTVYNKLYEDVEPILCYSQEGRIRTASKKSTITETDWCKITELIILSLFVLQSPRRILDYMIMYIVKKLPKNINREINYLDLSTRTFYFNNYKTSGTYKTQEVNISDKLYSLINCYIKLHPLKLTATTPIPLLCDYEGKPFNTSSQITKILNKIFMRYAGKKISVNLLRNIFLTDKFKPQMNELENIATQMGTSPGMIQNTYIKTD
jgi:hypothetical protein